MITKCWYGLFLCVYVCRRRLIVFLVMWRISKYRLIALSLEAWKLFFLLNYKRIVFRIFFICKRSIFKSVSVVEMMIEEQTKYSSIIFTHMKDQRFDEWERERKKKDMRKPLIAINDDLRMHPQNYTEKVENIQRTSSSSSSIRGERESIVNIYCWCNRL